MKKKAPKILTPMVSSFKAIVSLNTLKRLKLVLLVAGLGQLSACGGSGQDDGSVSTFSQDFSGRVIDGYLARATVFIDSNNNGSRDAWEAWAFTDNEGYYSYNPNRGTDYCADGASAQEQQYCLISNVEYSNVVIRIDSGYDIVTGEPFLGQMSRRVNAEVDAEVNDSLISPITSLLSNVEDTGQRSALLNALSIDEADLDVDYLNTDGADGLDVSLLNTALKIHKVVAVLSDRLTDTYDEIGENFGTPNDAASTVYPSLAEQIIDSGVNLDEALSDQNTLVSVLDAAEASLREVYERKEFDLPPDMGSLGDVGAFSRVVEVASEFSAAVNSLIDIEDTNFDLNDAVGGSRALEILVIKTVEESNNDDASIDNVINFFNVDDGDDDAQELVDTLLANLSLDSADISSLAENDFSGDDFDSVEEISAASSLGEDVQPFIQVGGLQLKVSELDLGDRPNDSNDSEVELYFAGEAGDVDGAFVACVKFIESANETTDTLGEGNTRGELVDGYWSLLGASEGDVESFSLLITINFLGATYQAIMKPAGNETVGEIDYKIFRFDNNGEFDVWHSEQGMVENVSVPTTSQACEDRLPSRLDL
ncbi:MAG: hypothetical protein ACI9Y1_001203 [Lentisphaeria bacterium]|jgi:hypothetical protein